MRAIIIVFLTVLLQVLPARAFAPESPEPIRIVLSTWSSQQILAKVTGEILRRIGYRVRYTPMTVDDQWGALTRGFTHFQVEVWEGTMDAESSRLLSEGRLADLGAHALLTREEWWYPAYVEEICPGLPDWRALNRCAALFAVPETAPKGRYLTGPWEKPERARVRALGMDFEVVEVKGAEELWRQLGEALEKRMPIVLFNWTPNWVEARHQGRFVEFPEWAPECETDPAWGTNPDFLYDCGNPTRGWLKKVAWPGLERKWPCAHRLLRNISFTAPMISELLAWVYADGMSRDQAAIRWVETRRSVWEPWIPPRCATTAAHRTPGSPAGNDTPRTDP